MKQFWLGVAATVVGGFLLFWLTNAYQHATEKELAKIEYKIDVAATFVAEEEVLALAKFLKSEDKEAKVALFSIENSGESVVRNANFYIHPTIDDFNESNLYGFGVADTTGEDTLAPSMIQKVDGIEVKFPYLQPGGGAVLWVAHKAPQGMSLIPENDNVKFDEISPWEEEEAEFPTLFVMIVGAIMLIAGIALNEILNRSFLKKAGYDYDAILKEYVEKTKKRDGGDDLRA